MSWASYLLVVFTIQTGTYLLYRSSSITANAPSELFGPSMTRPDEILYGSLVVITLILLLPILWRILEWHVHRRVGTENEEIPVIPDRFQRLAVALGDCFGRSMRRMSPKKLRKMIDRCGPESDGRGMLITLCDVEIPPVTRKFFEPHIVPPSQRFRGFFIALNLAFFLAGSMQLLNCWMIGRSVSFLRPVLGLSGVLVGLLMLLRMANRVGTVDYIRIAPGIVQFIQYPWLSGRKPRIRSYSPRCGDTFLLTQVCRVRGLAKLFRPPFFDWAKRIELKYQSPMTQMVFVGRGQKDKLFFSVVEHPEIVLARILDAITSTAKIPSLPEFELIG